MVEITVVNSSNRLPRTRGSVALHAVSNIPSQSTNVLFEAMVSVGIFGVSGSYIIMQASFGQRLASR